MDNKKAPIWRFPTTFIGGGIGFNDGGTQIFKDDSIQSLAREVCQNSIDAKHKDNDDPAEVEFITFKLKNTDFPGYEDFKNILEKELEDCKKFYKNNKKAINYYQAALDTIQNDEILCLRISDYNTTGLTTGNDERNNNWLNLVVHSGTNDKPEEAGGSFGLGKNAMYACSKLGTLYFSTFTDENEKKSECMSKLSEFQYDDNTTIHGLGFFGMYENNRSYENDKPIPELCYLDKNYTRREQETGTDVYILGFELPEDDIFSKSIDSYSKFEADICAALIDNYFESIIDRKLVVRINDILINSENIGDIFDRLYLYNPGLFNVNTKDYLDVLMDVDNRHVYPICIMDPEKSDAELIIKLDPKYHNKIAMIKNTGMKIFDKGNFPQKAIFSGLLTLKTNEVNGYFKRMENPAHDGWMLDRIKDDPTAKSKYDRMFNQIKEIIKQLAKENAPESLDVVGLGEYLPDDISEGKDDDKKEGITDDYSEKIEIIEKVQLPNIDDVVSNADGEDPSIDPSGSPDDEGIYEAHYGEKPGEGTGGGEKNEKTANDKKGKLLISKDNIVKNVKKRCYYSNGCYSLIIHPPIDMSNCKVLIQIAGEQANYNPTIVKAYKERAMFGEKSLNYSDNIILIGKIQKNEVTKIYFELDDDNDWPLEVMIYEN